MAEKQNSEEDEVVKINLKKIPVHSWAIATYILGILSIILIIMIFTGSSSGFTGNIISQKDMQKQVNDFVNTKLVQGGGVTVDNITEISGIYVASISVSGQNAPLYFTKDGKFISPGRDLIPINALPTTLPAVQDPSQINSTQNNANNTK